MKKIVLFPRGIRALTALLLAVSFVPAIAEEDTTQPFWHNGLQRDYQYYVPPTAGPNPPALMVLHGHSSDGNTFWAGDGLHDLADREGVVLIYPQGAHPHIKFVNGWNAGGRCCTLAVARNIDDNGFLRSVIKDMTNRHGLNPSRIYMVGHSNGAIMSHFFAARNDDLVAGIAPISFALQDDWNWRLPQDWHPRRPVPMHAYHSYPDEFITYEGGPLLLAGAIPTFAITAPLWINSAERGLKKWAEINGCDSQPTKAVRGYPGVWARDRDVQTQNANYFTYGNCEYGVPNNLVSLYQGTHVSVLDTSVTGLRMQEDVWSRVSDWRKPGHMGSELWQGVDLVIKEGEKLRSENGNWVLEFDRGGNRLYIRDAAMTHRKWQTAVPGSASRLVIRSGSLQAIRDGYWENYTVRHCVWWHCWNETKSRFIDPQVVWQSNGPVGERPAVRPDWRLALRDDGILTLTDAAGKVFWSSEELRLSKAGCEAAAPALSCPAGKNIKSGTMTYGRWNNYTCPHPTVSNHTAASVKQFPIPAAAIGRQSFQYPAINSVHADPYPSMYKHYEVNWICG